MQKGIPVSDELSKPFWDAVNQKRLVLQHSPPWLWMPDKASELTCRCRQRYKDAMRNPGGGGSGGALP
jgi:hypothetical protein